MANKLYIFILLFGCYYIFSGKSEPFYIVTGLISSFFGLYVAIKMDVVKSRGFNYKIFSYWLWLFKEILLSTIQVLKHVWFPWVRFKPGFVDFKTKQTHEMGYAMLGNSITLTPGTVCVYINDDANIITAHGLTEQGRKDIKDGVMDKKVLEIISCG